MATAPELVDSCDLRHQRLRQVEQLAAKSAIAIHEQGERIEHLDQSLAGLRGAYASTIIVVKASTHATTRLTRTVDRLDARLDHLFSTVEKDRRGLPRLAIALWGTSLTAFFALGTWLVHPFFPGIQAAWVTFTTYAATHGAPPK